MFTRGFVPVVLAASLVPAATAEEPKKELKLPAFTVPKGWTEQEPREIDKKFGLVVKRFRFEDGDKTSGVVVTASRGDGGGLANNVNRWRGQAWLKPLDDADAVKSLAPVKVDGRDAHVLDISAPEGKKSEGTEYLERIVAAVVTHDGQTVFIKLSGTAKDVGAQKKAFDEFLKSMRLAK